MDKVIATRPKWMSTFLVVLLCILLFTGAGCVSWYYFEKANNDESQALEDQIDRLEADIAKLKKASNAVTQVEDETSTTVTTTTPDPTEGWKTRNGKCLIKGSYVNYSVKYPSNWTSDKEFTSDTGEKFNLFCPAMQTGWTAYNLQNSKEIISTTGIVFVSNYGGKNDGSNGMLYYGATKGSTEIDERSVQLVGETSGVLSINTIETLDKILSTFRFID